jgi:hypothetical protein
MIDPAYLDRLGVFQDADGRYKRHRVRVRNPEYDPSDPKAELKGLLIGYDEELLPYPVVLPLATDPDSIEEARRKAAASGADFYHPRWGWLRWGIKPEKDHAENLGGASTPHPRRRVTLAAVEREPEPLPVPDPITEPGPDPEPETETERPPERASASREDRVPPPLPSASREGPPPASKGR